MRAILIIKRGVLLLSIYLSLGIVAKSQNALSMEVSLIEADSLIDKPISFVRKYISDKGYLFRSDTLYKQKEMTVLSYNNSKLEINIAIKGDSIRFISWNEPTNFFNNFLEQLKYSDYDEADDKKFFYKKRNNIKKIFINPHINTKNNSYIIFIMK